MSDEALDCTNLAFGEKVTMVCRDGHKIHAVVFGNKLGFEDGSYINIDNLAGRKIYSGWK